MPTLNYPASTSLPVGDGMTACGKKPHRSESLEALSFVLTVQSVEERTKKKKSQFHQGGCLQFQLGLPTPPQPAANRGAPI